ncbi:hypothetical protein BJ508DRAFT_323105 [Ascobolus immersus RN42]|uniref:RhoGAP-domain-containing protein n=1 Tax=Ascobolus immersus RN42 TaxID=1160509 RepID=A0A3N4ILA2_ASCIM|nr:hypothetical protein BJ508DRAFT_323105 [Ascobolus immersus RN42]
MYANGSYHTGEGSAASNAVVNAGATGTWNGQEPLVDPTAIQRRTERERVGNFNHSLPSTPQFSSSPAPSPYFHPLQTNFPVDNHSRTGSPASGGVASGSNLNSGNPHSASSHSSSSSSAPVPPTPTRSYYTYNSSSNTTPQTPVRSVIPEHQQQQQSGDGGSAGYNRTVFVSPTREYDTSSPRSPRSGGVFNFSAIDLINPAPPAPSPKVCSSRTPPDSAKSTGSGYSERITNSRKASGGTPSIDTAIAADHYHSSAAQRGQTPSHSTYASPLTSPTAVGTPRRLNFQAQNALDRLAEEAYLVSQDLADTPVSEFERSNSGAGGYYENERSGASVPGSPRTQFMNGYNSGGAGTMSSSSKNGLNGQTRLQPLHASDSDGSEYASRDSNNNTPSHYDDSQESRPYGKQRSGSFGSSVSDANRADYQDQQSGSSSAGPSRTGSTNSNSNNNIPSIAEIQNLIAQAGSAESVIQYLLKDKQNLNTQNTQLWRLVDKQRAMILGLNKDLERAVKEKDKYKERYKDAQDRLDEQERESRNHPTQYVMSPPAEDDAPPMTGTFGPKNMELPLPLQNASLQSPDVALAPYPLTPPGARTPLAMKSIKGEPDERMPSPSAHIVDSRPSSPPVQQIKTMFQRKESPLLHLQEPPPMSPNTQKQQLITPIEGLADDEEPITEVIVKDEAPDSPVSPLSAPKRLGVERTDTDETVFELDSQKTTRVPTPHAATFSFNNNDMPQPTSPAPPVPAPPVNMQAPPATQKKGLLSLSTTGIPAEKNPAARATPIRKAPPKPLDLINSNIKPTITKHQPTPPLARRKSEDTDSEDEPESRYSRDDRPRKTLLVKAIDGYESEESMLHTPDDKKGPPTAALNPGSDWSRQKERMDEEDDDDRRGRSRHRYGDSRDDEPERGRTRQRMEHQFAEIPPPPSARGPLASPRNWDNKNEELKPPTNLAQRLAAGPLSPGLPRSPRPQDRPPGSPGFPPPRVGLPSSPKPGATFSGIPGSPGFPRVGLPQSPRLGGFTPGSTLAPPDSPRFTTSILSTMGKPSSGLASPPLNMTSGGLVVGFEGKLMSFVTPKIIPDVKVRVVSSRLKPARHSMLPGLSKSGAAVFTLGIYDRNTGREISRVEKDYNSLIQLDTRLSQSMTKGCTEWIEHMPERSLFSGHAPARIDMRRDAIERYFKMILDGEGEPNALGVIQAPEGPARLDELARMALCDYFNSDVTEINSPDATSPDSTNSPLSAVSEGKPPVPPIPGPAKKEGYLTKRGKNFGGWKSRYFVLDSSVLRYYDNQNLGQHLGSIRLASAQIGVQSKSAAEAMAKKDAESADPENQYRHAFLILEPKKKDTSSLVRHVLCAESDAERDEWVKALMTWVEAAQDGAQTDTERPSTSGTISTKDSKKKSKKDKEKETFLLSPTTAEAGTPRIPNFDDHRASPDSGRNDRERATPTPPGSVHTTSSTSTLREKIGAPSAPTQISNLDAWGSGKLNAVQGYVDAKKKKSLWGFRGRSGSDPESMPTQAEKAGSSNLHHANSLGSSGHGHANFNPNVFSDSNGAGAGATPARLPPSSHVFGASLTEAVNLTRPFNSPVPVPAVVYRTLQYLHHHHAQSEEGIFRLSGSNVVIRNLRDRFNSESDIDLVQEEKESIERGEPGQGVDVHAVAGLLKAYLRELPENLLSSEREEFVRISDSDAIPQTQRAEKLRGLMRRIPEVNRALLKVLLGYLNGVVRRSGENRMTVRNVGIVFSPTLNIPAQVFSMLLNEYGAVFGDDGDVDYLFEAPRQQQQQQQEQQPQLQQIRHHRDPSLPPIPPSPRMGMSPPPRKQSAPASLAQLESMHRPSGSLDFFQQQQREHANHELSQKDVRERHGGETGQELGAPDYKAAYFQQQQAQQQQQHQQHQQLQHTPSKQSLHSQSGAAHPPRTDSHQPPNSASSTHAPQQDPTANPHAAFLAHLQNASLGTSPQPQSITSTTVLTPDQQPHSPSNSISSTTYSLASSASSVFPSSYTTPPPPPPPPPPPRPPPPPPPAPSQPQNQNAANPPSACSPPSANPSSPPATRPSHQPPKPPLHSPPAHLLTLASPEVSRAKL